MPTLNRADAEIHYEVLCSGFPIQKDWRGPEFLPESIRKVHAFLERNTPK